jgi:hypothetical protein
LLFKKSELERNISEKGQEIEEMEIKLSYGMMNNEYNS